MFERCLYFNINALTRAVNHIWDAAFSEFDLSPSHAYLLRLTLSTPGLTPKQISHELKLEKSTITRSLDALEKKGFINRKKGDSGDAREQSIYPTKKSIKIATQLEKKGNDLYQKMIKDIGKSELASLVGELRKTQTRIK
ncbi:MAG: MarR family transcriptional regulator [Gammaproteobacteria bacterium]|nr:MarR family transcriptional regulator [Gammaproteobacteria bacterium]